MKKVMLRKDYQTEVVPVADAVGRYLSKNAVHSWTETFMDADTKEPVQIERNEIIVHRGQMVTDKILRELEEQGIKEVGSRRHSSSRPGAHLVRQDYARQGHCAQ